MNLHLEQINIEQFRGINKYLLQNLGQWTTITGPNSTSKSTIIKAISLLGSNKMHELADIPSWIKSTEVNPLEISIKISYLFKIKNSFDKLMSDERIVELLISMYDQQLEYYKKKSAESDIIEHIKKSLTELRSKKPLCEIISDALYKTIRNEVEPNPGNKSYKPLFDKKGFYKMPEEIFNEGKFLKITLEMSLSDGPNFNFLILDGNKEPLVNEEVFYHWLNNQQAIDSDITLGYVIGSIFIKSIVADTTINNNNNLPTHLSSDGSNIIHYIEYCLTHHPNILKNLSNYFRRIFNKSIEFKKSAAGSSPEEGKILIKIEGDNNWFSIDKLSDGMMHVLRILFQLTSSIKGDIIIIDEPEKHLHPGAARCLREVLSEKKSELQIICATHSPIFIEPTVVDNVILNQEIDGNISPRILNAKNIDKALTELGTSGLDSLLYDVVIWVEGPSDKIYLEKWLDLLRTEYSLIPNTQLGILPYGGKSALTYFNIEEIKTINRKSIFVIDNDEKVTKSIKDFITECYSNGIYCWLTKRRSIENYIPIEILEEKLNLTSGSLEISQSDNVIKKIKRAGKNYKNKKVFLAKLVAPSFQLKHIKCDKDFLDELNGLVKHLKTLNH